MNLLMTLKPTDLPARLKEKDDLTIQREIILQYILNAVSLLGVIGFFVWLFAGGYREILLSILFGSAIAWVVFITINRDLPYRLRAATMLGLIFFEAITTLSRNGLEGNGAVCSLALAILTGILFGPRFGIGSFFAMLLLNSVIGYLMVNKVMSVPTVIGVSSSASQSGWTSEIVALILYGAVISGAIYQIMQGLTNSINQQKKLSREIDRERSLLEKRVSERTLELTMKAAQLEASRRVASKIADETEIDSILKVAVDVIREQFNFYHAGIFLFDKLTSRMVLTSATGEAGRKMLEAGHSLSISEDSMVGYVMIHSEARVSGNVEDDPIHYKNPLLPDTRSEMAVPLIIVNQIIGVLDVQSSIRNAFTGDDIEIISTLANQVASALDRARLMDKLKQSISELEEVQRQSTRMAWQKHLKNSRRHFAYQYKLSQVEVLEKNNASFGINQPIFPVPQEIEILSDYESGTRSSSAQPFSTIVVPIKLRNQVLGTVKLRLTSSNVSDDMLHLVEGAIERLAISLENARLLEEIQVRVERERMVSDISNKVRSVTDVESILRIAAGELGHSLGVSEVVVQLSAKD